MIINLGITSNKLYYLFHTGYFSKRYVDTLRIYLNFEKF